MIFKELNLIEPIQKALNEQGYEKATEIQEQAIPHILKGRDVLGCAQTGTGKTAAFSLPILQRLVNEKNNEAEKIIKVLILAPTRELAIQIGENIDNYSKYIDLKNTVIFGGVNQTSQIRKIKAGIDILVATPGRLLDLVNQKHIDLSKVKYFVLDEADKMLDMGMIHDVKKIIAKMPKNRQNMLFSATMPKTVEKFVNSILINPVKVEVTPVSSTVEIINQGVYFIEKKNKKSLLVSLLQDKSMKSVLVFSRTKHGANKIAKDLNKFGIESEAIHGNKSQNARQLALSNFKEGKTRVLVATDIAARGIDINDLSYVINYDLPDVPETYVHRIGRTGRAGRTGTALTFCEHEEKSEFKRIERVIGKEIEVLSHEIVEVPMVVDTEAIKKEVEKKSSNRNSNKKSHNYRKGNSNKKSGRSFTYKKGKGTSNNTKKNNKSNNLKQDK